MKIVIVIRVCLFCFLALHKKSCSDTKVLRKSWVDLMRWSCLCHVIIRILSELRKNPYCSPRLIDSLFFDYLKMSPSIFLWHICLRQLKRGGDASLWLIYFQSLHFFRSSRIKQKASMWALKKMDDDAGLPLNEWCEWQFKSSCGSLG